MYEIVDEYYGNVVNAIFILYAYKFEYNIHAGTKNYYCWTACTHDTSTQLAIVLKTRCS